MIRFYRLEGRTPVACSTEEHAEAWGARYRAIEDGRPDPWRVDRTIVGPCEVSTVFLGLDHGFLLAADAPPILFETMAFGPHLFHEAFRTATWAAAQAMHDQIVADVRQAVEGRAVTRYDP